MPKPATPVIQGLEHLETYKGGPRAGQTWNDELPCLIVQEPDGHSGIMCRWELTEEDRKAVAAGADVILTLFIGDRGMPPMYVEVWNAHKVDILHLVKHRGIIEVPDRIRKYTDEQVAQMRRRQ
jgi:hypothetical protein